MSIITSFDKEETSPVERRISADLRNRVKAESQSEKNSQENYLKDLKKSSRISWIWFVMIVLALASLILIIL